MELKSRIKEVFSEEMLKYIGALCDTRRIDSAQRKMLLSQQLLKRYDVKFIPLGGATNRLAAMIKGYTFKIALDRQGYKDNLIEYSLSQELQPYVTKSFETNGYIVLAETVKTMTKEDFEFRRTDILKVLETLSQDYLLGDVGYIKRNFTNWGIRDDGEAVILDYAYCHRATEELFRCEVCGAGVLRYDSTYTYLKCSNATVCSAKFTYTERKMVQGDQVDWDLIDESFRYSVKVGEGETSAEVSDNDGVLENGNIKVINNLQDYLEYNRRKNRMSSRFDAGRMLSLQIEEMDTDDPIRLQEIYREMAEMMEPDDDDGYEYRFDMDAINAEMEEEEEDDYDGYGDPDIAAYQRMYHETMAEVERKERERGYREIRLWNPDDPYGFGEPIIQRIYFEPQVDTQSDSVAQNNTTSQNSAQEPTGKIPATKQSAQRQISPNMTENVKQLVVDYLEDFYDVDEDLIRSVIGLVKEAADELLQDMGLEPEEPEAEKLQEEIVTEEIPVKEEKVLPVEEKVYDPEPPVIEQDVSVPEDPITNVTTEETKVPEDDVKVNIVTHHENVVVHQVNDAKEPVIIDTGTDTVEKPTVIGNPTAQERYVQRLQELFSRKPNTGSPDEMEPGIFVNGRPLRR